MPPGILYGVEDSGEIEGNYALFFGLYNYIGTVIDGVTVGSSTFTWKWYLDDGRECVTDLDVGPVQAVCQHLVDPGQ